jgi:hypothetical protein
MQVARADLGVAAVNGKIYAIGGSTQSFTGIPAIGSGITGEVVNINEQYDPETNNWTFKAPMPTSRAEFGIAVFQDKIYCIGGITNHARTGVNEIYDPATDTWTTKAPMPSPVSGQANVVSGKIYVFSGDSYGTGNQVYDPLTDSWTVKTAWSRASFRWVSAAFNDKIHVLGGIDPLASGAEENQIYDAEKNTWSSANPSLTVLGGAAVSTTGVLAPKRIYVMGLGFSTLYPNYIYNPEQNAWTTGTSMPTGRTNFGIAAINDTLYVIGGDTNPSFEKAPVGGVSSWVPSAVNEQYFPVGYGTPDPSYVLEHYAPTVSILTAQNQTFNDSEVSLEFSLDKPVTWIGYSLDEQQNITVLENNTLTNGTITNIAVANVTNGFHNLIIYANDTYGNVGSQTYNFTVASPSTAFPTVLAVVAIAVIGVALSLVVYLKKYRHRKSARAT